MGGAASGLTGHKDQRGCPCHPQGDGRRLPGLRSGRIDCDDGLRLTHVLELLGKSHESASIGHRLGGTEKVIGVKADNHPGWVGLPFEKDET